MEAATAQAVQRLAALLGARAPLSGVVFMGRIGAGAAPRSRSLRLPLQRLEAEGGRDGG